MPPDQVYQSKINFNSKQLSIMLRWAATFFIIALVAALFGFTGIASGAAAVAKALFFIFIVLFLLTLVFGATLFRK
jgi:uncharacterized membrane protein YtjA (UPF0391 family)